MELDQKTNTSLTTKISIFSKTFFICFLLPLSYLKMHFVWSDLPEIQSVLYEET